MSGPCPIQVRSCPVRPLVDRPGTLADTHQKSSPLKFDQIATCLPVRDVRSEPLVVLPWPNLISRP